MSYKKYLIFLFFLSGLASRCFSQQKLSVSPVHFHSINQLGLLEGSIGNAFQIQSINGIQFKKWYAGIGTGLDYYRYRSIPLFADIRKNFCNGPQSFFLYADAGIHFIWVRDGDKKAYSIGDHFRNGFYGDAGLGYLISFRKISSLIISAGFSYEEFTEKLYYPAYPMPNLPLNDNSDRFDYYFNRLSLKIGFQF